MKVAFFDTHGFDREAFVKIFSASKHELVFHEVRLTKETVALVQDAEAVCAFVNDRLDFDCLEALSKAGVKLVALRCAGFNQVDLAAAREFGVEVARVPGYSPHAVAEYALALLLTLNRKIHKSYVRVKELNFSLDGLVGTDIFGKTVGVIGTGKIGAIFCQITNAMGCRVLAHDVNHNPALADVVDYVPLERIWSECDVISLHIPLTKETHHLINKDVLNRMKDGAYIVNTGRGGLIDSLALLDALKSKRLGGVALDVYEEEEAVFFRDLSTSGLADDVLARLLSFPQVLVSSHQAFLTQEALSNIAETTLLNIDSFAKTGRAANRL